MKTAKLHLAQNEEGRPARPKLEDRRVQAQAVEQAANDARTSNEVLVTSNPVPAKAEVFAAVHRSLNTNGKRLLQGGSQDAQASATVVDSLRIVALNLLDNSGLAEVEVTQMGTFQHGKVVPKRTIVRRNMIMSRQELGWVVDVPQDLVQFDRNLAMAHTDRQPTAPVTPAKPSGAARFK